jgi:hypothetical protein
MRTNATHSSITPRLATMKCLIFSALATQVLGHAIWQDLWVNGVDKGSTCVRLPGTSYVSNSPVTVSHSLNIGSSSMLIALSERILQRHTLQRRRLQRCIRQMSSRRRRHCDRRNAPTERRPRLQERSHRRRALRTGHGLHEQGRR